MKNKAEMLMKINMWISKYLLIAFPFVVAVIIWALMIPSIDREANGLEKILWEVLSWNFLTWFTLLVYFILTLVFWSPFREKILTVITYSKERDERESYISGRASKATFYSTLAVLIFLFFLSGLNVHIYRKPKEEAIDGKRGAITIGYNFGLMNTDKKNAEAKFHGKNEVILEFNGLPFTQESLLLFLVLYHVASYHIFTRRRQEDI